MVVIPAGYPDKLKSLLQALAIGDIHVLLVRPDDPLDALMGEMIIALTLHPAAVPFIAVAGVDQQNEYLVDQVGKKLMAIVDATPGLKGKIDKVHVVRDFKEDMGRLKTDITGRAASLPRRVEEPVKIIIDAVFPVKGIGTVILGIVKAGRFNAGAMLELTGPTGQGKNVIAKSIQMHDIDHKEASHGDRVGVAVKGIKPEEVSRDNMLVFKGSATMVNTIKVKLSLSGFAKKPVDISEKQAYHVAIDHQVYPAMPIAVEGTNLPGVLGKGETGTVTFKSDKKFALAGADCLAVVCILEQFQGKLRVLGSGPASA